MATTGIYTSTTNYVHELPDVVQTTNATVTTVASIAIPVSRAILIKYSVLGVQSDFTNAIGGEVWGLFRRGSSGNIFQVGAIRDSLNRDSSFATCDTYFELDNSGYNVLIRVKGKTATTINWTIETDYLIKL